MIPGGRERASHPLGTCASSHHRPLSLLSLSPSPSLFSLLSLPPSPSLSLSPSPSLIMIPGGRERASHPLGTCASSHPHPRCTPATPGHGSSSLDPPTWREGSERERERGREGGREEREEGEGEGEGEDIPTIEHEEGVVLPVDDLLAVGVVTLCCRPGGSRRDEHGVEWIPIGISILISFLLLPCLLDDHDGVKKGGG